MANKEITKEDIVETLKVIKTVCKESNECRTCPFGKIDDTCTIKGITPNVWIINGETDVWRALR